MAEYTLENIVALEETGKVNKLQRKNFLAEIKFQPFFFQKRLDI